MLSTNDIKNLKMEEKYYSVGPLQNGQIEEWNYTGDLYDISRIMSNNFYSTEKEALDFLRYMLKYEKEEHIPEYAFKTSVYGI